MPDEEPIDERQADKADAPVIDVSELFGDRREICLELEGVRYRLRITRKNKLILQK